MSVDAIRARLDRQIQGALSQESDVKKALERVRTHRAGHGLWERRELLSKSLRLTRGMAPSLADAVKECRNRLKFEEPVELFVNASPNMGAWCIRPWVGPPAIVLTSRLLESMTLPELRFVVGHELGHLAMNHTHFPMPALAKVQDLAGTIVTQKSRLQLYVWCRAAEVSADRAGLICAEDTEAAGTGFFKLTSGLASAHVQTDLEAFARQADGLASAPEALKEGSRDDDHLDCFSTHPYSPIRVRALLAFSKSRAYADWLGKGSGELANEEMENQVEEDLRLMEPSYLEEQTAPSDEMRRALFHAGVLVAHADGKIHPSEVQALTALLGHEHSVEAIEKMKDSAVASWKTAVPALNKMPFSQRARLIQHVAIIASCDGEIENSELERLAQLAADLHVDERLVHQTLSAMAAPLD